MIEHKTIGQLDYLDVKNESARAKIALQGAHIFFFQAKDKKPLLWSSQTAFFKEGVAIRGGIPICWPWFGVHESDPKLPKHGFARISRWELLSTQELTPKLTKVRLLLASTKETRSVFAFDFELILEIHIGETLTLSLTTHNKDTKPFTISSALHTYFLISDIKKVEVQGLNKPLVITQEHDVIYEDVTTPLGFRDVDQVITIQTQGSKSAVIWNPGKEVASTMDDLSDYTTMLCIESANVLSDKRKILPNERHTLQATFIQETL